LSKRYATYYKFKHGEQDTNKKAMHVRKQTHPISLTRGTKMHFIY